MPKAARFYKIGEPLRIEEVPIPKLKENEVLIKIRGASMCHSDVHATTGVLVATPSITLGHEIAGDIEEVGADVTGVKKGDRVVVYFMSPCNDCDRCYEGMSNVCRNINSRPMYGFNADGGYAEYIKVNAYNVVPLPDGVPYDFGASLGCAGITALHAVRISKVGLGDTVAVYGMGGVGMYVSQLAKLAGATTVIAIGRTEEKLRMAQEKFGADVAINLSKEKLRDAVKKVTGGKGVDTIFDFVVNGESVESSTRAISNGGRLVLVGMGEQPVSINPKILSLREISVVGSYVGSKEELQLLTQLAKNGKIKGVVNAKYPLDKVNEVIAALKEGRIAGRACFDVNP